MNKSFYDKANDISDRIGKDEKISLNEFCFLISDYILSGKYMKFIEWLKTKSYKKNLKLCYWKNIFSKFESVTNAK